GLPTILRATLAARSATWLAAPSAQTTELLAADPASGCRGELAHPANISEAQSMHASRRASRNNSRLS
ncbi:MAG: hypothetical protein OEZ08_09060, partial [Betaproteobacteria bacterium]|nr:hypothetical protein [Betaproteobacteria bacterium]